MTEIRFDVVEDVFGLLYRVWGNGEKFLGSFYQAIDGQWVVQPCGSDVRPRVATMEEATSYWNSAR